MATSKPSQLLRAAGLSPTRQRTGVLQTVRKVRQPMTAQRVHAELVHNPRISIGLATVYRILHSLAAAGLVHEIDMRGQRAYRACRRAAHHHLVCDRCGSVSEYPAALAETWLRNINGVTGFRPSGTAGDIHGTCPTCPYEPLQAGNGAA